jgi:hypothetical protein
MALENRDYLLLADIMKYEVIPFLKKNYLDWGVEWYTC